MADSEWVKVASTTEMREGEGYETGVQVGGDTVGLFLIEGKYFAVGECTHESGPVCQGMREGFVVMCPWHSAKYDVRDGHCVQGPIACRVDGQVEVGELSEAERCDPIRCYEVKVEGEDIFVRPRPRGAGPA